MKMKDQADKILNIASRVIPTIRVHYGSFSNDFLRDQLRYELFKKNYKDLCLNLGCGDDIRTNYINIDKYASKCDFKYDLEQLPLPFDDGCCKKILLLNTLEHLFVKHYDFMMEIWRILKVGGIVKIELPLIGFQINHVSGLHSRHYFDQLCVGRSKSKSSQSNEYFTRKIAKYRFYPVRNPPYIRFHTYFELVKKDIEGVK